MNSERKTERASALNPSGRMFLTAAEVGEQLGVRKSRVYELAVCGLIPSVRLGRRLLFPRRGLEELAEAAIEKAKVALQETARDHRD